MDQAQALWRNITCPTLLVDAAESRFLPQIPDRAERYACIPHARQHVLAGADHMMHRHQPRALAEVLTELLDD